MGLFDFLKAGAGQPATRGFAVEFDEDGRVSNITAPEQGGWIARQSGSNKYLNRSAGSLMEATEILRRIESIPGLTYYTVDTPDGRLGRDMSGYYTEAPLKTKGLKVPSRRPTPGPVELASLTGFGDTYQNGMSIVALMRSGEYARLVLLMECGRCGYQSPVETQEGPLVRECYCCGAQNSGGRGAVNVVLSDGIVEI
jgi:hypothetical protein